MRGLTPENKLLGFWGRSDRQGDAFPGRGGRRRGLDEVNFGSEGEARPPGALALNAGSACKAAGNVGMSLIASMAFSGSTAGWEE